MGKPVHFRIEGAFITHSARSLWAEGELVKALELLRDVHGPTDEQRFAILEGRMKFTGDSTVGVGIAEDNFKGSTLLDVLKKLHAERDDYKDQVADWVQMALSDTEIVGSPTGPRLIPLRKASRFKPGMLAKGWEFSDMELGPGEKPLQVWQDAPRGSTGLPFKRDGFKPPREDSRTRYSLVPEEDDEETESPSASFVPRPTLVTPDDDEDDYPPPPPPAHDTITSDTGWLSPEGKFYACKYGQHRETADALKVNDWEGSGPGGQWVRIFVYDDAETMFSGERDLITDTQKKLIRQYCEEQKKKIPYFLED